MPISTDLGNMQTIAAQSQRQMASQLSWCITSTRGGCLLSRCRKEALKVLSACPVILMTYFHRIILPIFLLFSIVLTQEKHALGKRQLTQTLDQQPLVGLADLVKLAYQGVRPEQRSTLTLVEFRRLLEAEHNVSKLTLMQHQQQIKAFFQQLVMQSAGASYLQPQAGDETHREYLAILYEKEAMRLHCAFGHCSDKKLLLSLNTKSYCYL